MNVSVASHDTGCFCRWEGLYKYAGEERGLGRLMGGAK